MAELIQVDGSQGGGQILRSALSLSALTGKPFVIEQIRKKRTRGGLMRQHLTAVKAAAAICDAEVRGAELSATRLEFRPGKLRAGHYEFAIGTAGSTCLVLQTVLPPLLAAGAASELTFSGGTHNPQAPSFPFLDRVFFPLIERMGASLSRALLRAGFYPAGGGSIALGVAPAERLLPLELRERGEQVRLHAEVLIANIPHDVARRELAVVKKRMAFADQDLLLRTPDADGPGNVLLLFAEHTGAMEIVSSFGARGVTAERVAENACLELATYLRADVPVGEHLSDQLLLPMAMAGAGSFDTCALTDHARTNMRVIQQFLPVHFELEQVADERVRITIQS
jgi:RNA 3'-terminal phosphate cyclase (ATP)